MDSITQIVLGAAVGEAVAGKKLGRRAAVWGAVAGTIPDLDVFLRLISNPIDGALLHRGFSHSIVFACIAGPLLGWLIHRLYKKRFEQRDWIKLFFWAIITHPMLDIFTNYGTEIFWPYSMRVTINSVFVMDPLYTVPFMICLIVALSMRSTNKWRARWNWTGIIYSCLYLAWGVILKLNMLSHSDQYFAESGVKAERTMAGPMPLTSFYWMMMTENDTAYHITYKSIFSDYDPLKIETIEKNHINLDTLKWAGKDYTSTLKFIADDWYSTVWQNDTLNFYDLRFGTTTELTNRTQMDPFMGFGMVVDNGIVQKTLSFRGSKTFEHVNFDVYWDNVFGKHE